MNRVLFREEQKFTQWWIYLLLFFMAGLLSYAIFQQIFLGKPFGNNPASDTGLLAASGGLVLLVWFMLSLRLVTEISEEGIYYRFRPFHRKPRFLAWDEITEAELLSYHPIREYGGWGLRYGRGGRAFNVKGKIGLKVHLKTGRHILFGTQEPHSLSKTLELLDINFINRLGIGMV